MPLAEFLATSGWGTMLRAPLRLIPRNAVVPILRGPLRGKRWVAGSHRHACWLGIYEPELQELIKQRLRPGAVFFDIGANAGLYTLLAANQLGAGRVYSFEPLPVNVSNLRKHVDLNHFRNVNIFNVAVSDCEGQASFEIGITCADGRLAPGGNLTVSTVSLDSMISHCEVKPPNYIKMDIEGGEFRALQGAKECFTRYRPELFLATHGKIVHDQCCESLRSWKYATNVAYDVGEDRGAVHAVPV